MEILPMGYSTLSAKTVMTGKPLVIPHVADGQYHTYTMEWRTLLKLLPNIKDSQVVKKQDYWWVQDKGIPFDFYLGNPMKRLGKDQYAVYWGHKAEHWIDGKKIGENGRHVPVMAAQLTLGIWLPDWGGRAPGRCRKPRSAR